MSLANLDLSVSLLSFQSKKQDHKLPKVFKVGDIVNTAKYTLVIVKIVTNKSFFGIIICKASNDNKRMFNPEVYKFSELTGYMVEAGIIDNTVDDIADEKDDLIKQFKAFINQGIDEKLSIQKHRILLKMADFLGMDLTEKQENNYLKVKVN